MVSDKIWQWKRQWKYEHRRTSARWTSKYNPAKSNYFLLTTREKLEYFEEKYVPKWYFAHQNDHFFMLNLNFFYLNWIISLREWKKCVFVLFLSLLMSLHAERYSIHARKLVLAPMGARRKIIILNDGCCFFVSNILLLGTLAG